MQLERKRRGTRPLQLKLVEGRRRQRKSIELPCFSQEGIEGMEGRKKGILHITLYERQNGKEGYIQKLLHYNSVMHSIFKSYY